MQTKLLIIAGLLLVIWLLLRLRKPAHKEAATETAPQPRDTASIEGGTGSFQQERRGRSDRRQDADTDLF